jgi:hypothetical protein
MSNVDHGKLTGWGVIRYAAGSGTLPDQDAAAFNGWYAHRADALAVAERWSTRYPQWIVALVQGDTGWFGDGDFTTVRDQPLTKREALFRAVRAQE